MFTVHSWVITAVIGGAPELPKPKGKASFLKGNLCTGEAEVGDCYKFEASLASVVRRKKKSLEW